MTSERLRSRVVVDSCIRSAEISGHPAAVLRRGDPDAGSVFIKVYSRSGNAYLYGQSLTEDGKWNWRNLLPENSRQKLQLMNVLQRNSKLTAIFGSLKC